MIRFSLAVRAGILATLAVPVAAHAQRVPVTELSLVAARSGDGFTRVSSVRELRDGRVIVVDSDDRSVYLLDRGLSMRQMVGRQGAGPGEYTHPQHVVALSGDSSGVLDGSRTQILVISPEGRPVGLLGPLQVSATLSTGRFRATSADRRGYLYSRGAPVARIANGEMRLVDSAAIERWHPDTGKRDTAGFVPVSTEGARVVAGMLTWRAADRPAFSSESQWAVAADGMLAIVKLNPYAVDFIGRDGLRRRGAPVRYEAVRVSEAHKEQWRAEQRRPRPMTVVRFDQPGSAAIRMGTFPFTEPENWPRTMPPFLHGAARFAPDGMLWVQRTIEVGDPPTFDIFERSGRLVRQVRLPKMTRLVGFGERCVYVVWKDEVDLEYLQRIQVQ